MVGDRTRMSNELRVQLEAKVREQAEANAVEARRRQRHEARRARQGGHLAEVLPPVSTKPSDDRKDAFRAELDKFRRCSKMER